jgi:hypothetical protein
MRASAATSTRRIFSTIISSSLPTAARSQRRAVGGPDGIGLCIAEKVLSAELFVI